MILESIPGVVEGRAQLQPDGVAFTFIDYDVDPAGYAESLTWSEMLKRVQVVAKELLRRGSPGDRAAILAPQGLDYIVAFYGAIYAGFVAVPLPVPAFGVLDERVAGALRDSSPTAVLTTSATLGDIITYSRAQPGGAAPAVIEVDALDYVSPVEVQRPEARGSDLAYLQYTSGSTRSPAGVEVTHRNVFANGEQMTADYFENFGKEPPPDTTLISWLPFYHDMGLILGVLGPMCLGLKAVLMSPVAFLLKPARWMQQLASHPHAFSGAPNFAFELASKRTTDDEMAGLDLSGVLAIGSGSERVHVATIRRFNERFAPYNLPDTALRPSYGLAEAMVYVLTSPAGQPPETVRFDTEKLSAGYAKRCGTEDGTELVSYGTPRSTTVRVVDPETSTEKQAGQVGEIWVHGENVSAGYYRNPEQTERTFGGKLVDPSPGTPPERWLRTGDLGVFSSDELFVIGRIKDLLIVNGRNHYPDDIEATIQEITGGRVAAISVAGEESERLVVIVERKQRGASAAEVADSLAKLKRDITAEVSKSHNVGVSDVVLVAPGSIPITTSGKVRRASCVDQYRDNQFIRLDVTV